MRGKNKIKTEVLNQRLKQLTGCPDDVDLRKMTLAEVYELIERSRPRMAEIARNHQAGLSVHTKDNGSSYHNRNLISTISNKLLSLSRQS